MTSWWRGGSLALMCALVACDPAQPVSKPRDVAPADALLSEQSQGPVKVVTAVWPKAPVLGEPIYYQLAITNDGGATVAGDFLVSELGRFKVERHIERTDDKTTFHTFELAAPLSGRYRIPAFRLGVVAPDNPGGEAELLIDEVPLTVAPLPDSGDDTLQPGPGELPIRVGGIPWWMATLLGAVFGGLLVVAWRLRLRRSHASRVMRVSAYAAARAGLSELQARGAPGPELPVEQDAWFVDLSGVVRTYLEGRFAIRAPELTTEEFLAAAMKHPDLTSGHRALLQTFLLRCDEVKFAGYRPTSDESLGALQAALQFVNETRPTTEAA